MTDCFTKEKRSDVMSKIRSVSKLEKLPDSLKRGHYLRAHPEGVSGSPDFGNKVRKVALFIDGCFWHGCPDHYREPKSNVEFWRSKVRRNRERDRLVNSQLMSEGWTVIRIWEHEFR